MNIAASCGWAVELLLPYVVPTSVPVTSFFLLRVDLVKWKKKNK